MLPHINTTSSARPAGHTGSARRSGDELTGTMPDYIGTGTNLIDRWQPLTDWLDRRAEMGVDPYSRRSVGAITTTTATYDRVGRRFRGVNFASQDYLSLSSHPSVVAAATAAAHKHGVHSAGSAVLMGLSDLTVRLEQTVAEFLGVADATVFPTGWGAGYGIVKTLVKPDDHVVIDVLAHACLQEGARNATRHVHQVPHLSTEAVARRLRRIREIDPLAGILVVTETVFSMDSDVPDLAALQRICHEHDATLVVDVAHDLGAIGPTGRGYLEFQDMVGKIDVVMGSFSKTFASNGGFVASNHPALKLALRYACGPLAFTNAMSPIQAAAILACFDVIRGADGDERRRRLLANVLYMRDALGAAGFEVMGLPSAIVPVMIGDSAEARLMTRHMLSHGALVNLVEFPGVAKNKARWRAQVMADHTREQIDKFVETAVAARRSVRASGGTTT